MASNSSAQHRSLPPSVEEAYRRKCVELRRRTLEVEAQNDQYRLSITRLNRGIKKQRFERAVLMDHLAKLVPKNGTGTIPVWDDESENSSEAAPTPQERPLRAKRSHRRVPDLSSPSIAPQGGMPPMATGSSTQPAMGSQVATPLGSAGPIPTTSNPLDGHAVHLDPPMLNPDSELLPLPLPSFDPSGTSYPPGHPDPPRELFKTHIVRAMPLVPERYSHLTNIESKVARAYEIWDEELDSNVKEAWIEIHDELARRWKRGEDNKQWERVRGTVRPRSAAAADASVDSAVKEEEDVVMRGLEDE